MSSPVKDPHTKTFSHNNGTVEELLARLAVQELCKGWPVYRDASEWANFRSLFTDDAKVWTTWSGPLHVDDFIEVSEKGKARDVFIMHRECGTLAELDLAKGRAVGKMKATITHRFGHESGDPAGTFDVDCDCRFIFFCLRDDETGSWKASLVKLFYDKDKIVPALGANPPQLSDEEVAVMQTYPAGYRLLGIMQRRLGYEIDVSLATGVGEGAGRMYAAMEQWLDGKAVDLDWHDPAKR